MNVSTLSDKPGCCRRRFVSSVTIQTSLTANHMKASLSRLNYTQHRFNRTYAWMLEASRGWVRAGPQTQSSPTCVSSLLLCPFSLFVLAWRTQGQLVPPQHTPYRMCQVRTGPPLAVSLHNQNISYALTKKRPCTCTTRFHTLDGDRLQVVITSVTTDLPGLFSLDLENVTKARCH